MLESLDVLIGFVVVMLVVSMAVTMITQFMITAVLKLRGKALHEGLSHLLALMDQGLSREEAAQVADHILRNPLVGTASVFGGKVGLASVIHREELTKLLLDFSIPGPADTANPESAKAGLRAAFRASLARNGISDPEEILRQVRTTVVELEKANPELSHSMRANLALLNCAASDFLSKLNSWFDQTVDRASDIFTRRVRLVTGVVALILAVVLQLDAIGLINRLSVDAPLRNNLVQSAIQQQSAWKQQVESLEAQSAAIANASSATSNLASGNESAGNSTAAGGNESDGNSTGAVPTPAGNSTQPAVPAATPGSRDDPLVRARNMVEELGVVSVPGSLSEWRQTWSWERLFGILLAAALLSLGAPFWYAILANLLKLRSVIAGKDEAQREERQTTQEMARPIAMTPAAQMAPEPPTPRPRPTRPRRSRTRAAGSAEG